MRDLLSVCKFYDSHKVYWNNSRKILTNQNARSI